MKPDLDDMNDFIMPEGEEDVTPVSDRVSVTVTFIVRADSEDDAIADVKQIIDEGIVVLSDDEQREPVISYDITESEPTEVD
jgi:hypothetical protein